MVPCSVSLVSLLRASLMPRCGATVGIYLEFMHAQPGSESVNAHMVMLVNGDGSYRWIPAILSPWGWTEMHFTIPQRCCGIELQLQIVVFHSIILAFPCFQFHFPLPHSCFLGSQAHWMWDCLKLCFGRAQGKMFNQKGQLSEKVNG